MIGRIRRAYHRQQFDPSWLGIFVNPFFFARRALHRAVTRDAAAVKGKVLDVGCGSRPYETLFANARSYVGMDVERSGHDRTGERVDVFYDGIRFPFPPNSFDALVCFEVLEHVFTPDKFLKEARRVVRPGGKLLFTVPFVWDEHEQPYDFARYSSFGLRAMFERNGLRVVSDTKYLNDLRLLVLLFNTYAYKLFRKALPAKWFLVPTLAVTGVANLIGSLAVLLPRSEDLYFGNIFVLQRPEGTPIVSRRKGRSMRGRGMTSRKTR